jgi:hypothetical protein
MRRLREGWRRRIGLRKLNRMACMIHCVRDHRFFAVRSLVEKGKYLRNLNRRLKLGEKDDRFLMIEDEQWYRNDNEIGYGECIKILRVENGSLNEIASELIGKVPSSGVVPGTVLMLGSAVQQGMESIAFLRDGVEEVPELAKERAGECDCHPPPAPVTRGDCRQDSTERLD